MSHPHWENPETLGFGRLPAGAHFHRYATLQQSQSGRSSRDKALSSGWRFCRVSHPSEAPDQWQTPSFDDTAFKAITLPALWTMDPDFEDQPIYTNVRMPFRQVLMHRGLTNGYSTAMPARSRIAPDFTHLPLAVLSLPLLLWSLCDSQCSHD